MSNTVEKSKRMRAKNPLCLVIRKTGLSFSGMTGTGAVGIGGVKRAELRVSIGKMEFSP